jgi:hypothetical protein
LAGFWEVEICKGGGGAISLGNARPPWLLGEVEVEYTAKYERVEAKKWWLKKRRERSEGGLLGEL